MKFRLALLCLLLMITLSAKTRRRAYIPSNIAPPAPMREFRGVWVATVANIDWPSKPGLPTDRQQGELLAILDQAASMHLNAIILQIRPACDALYDSKIEPWSEYLTGQQGLAPDPAYDPLAFAVEEAHKRGLELHAWFNPYRARHNEAKSPVCDTHISKTQPALVKNYAGYLWLDPAEKAVQDYSLNVILDVVKRYDIDGVHIDDYFYPYKERGPDGKILPFPDDASWHKYQQRRGKLSRDDWRRDNVNRFIERLYKGVKATKKWVKVGISPFGIWRPGSPESVKGFDAYQEIYADSRLWLNKGWLDYWTPQLYWRIGQTGQAYPALLRWWVEQNTQHRHLWAGNYTSRVADDSKTPWPADEIVHQVELTRKQPGATGNVHFSMKALRDDVGGVRAALANGPYAQTALVPATPWLNSHAPGRPELEARLKTDDSVTLNWNETEGAKVWLWLLQTRVNGVWTTDTIGADETTRSLLATDGSPLPDAIALSAVDRCGNLSQITTLEITHE